MGWRRALRARPHAQAAFALLLWTTGCGDPEAEQPPDDNACCGDAERCIAAYAGTYKGGYAGLVSGS